MQSADHDNATNDTAYRTFWRRVGAGIADQIVLLPLVFLDEWVWSLKLSFRSAAMYLIVSESVFLLYSILMHGLFGQTLGKMLMKVTVVDLAERAITMRQAVLRDSPGLAFQLAFLPMALINLHSWIAFERGELNDVPRWILLLGFGALLMFLIEIATMLTNRRRRALHDFIAGTVVIKVQIQGICISFGRCNTDLVPNPKFVFQGLVLLVALLIFAVMVILLKRRSGKSFKAVLADHKKLQALSLAQALILMIGVFVAIILIKNE